MIFKNQSLVVDDNRTRHVRKLAKPRAYSRILVKHEGKYSVNFEHAFERRHETEKLFETRGYSYPNSEIGLDSGWKRGKIHPGDMN